MITKKEMTHLLYHTGYYDSPLGRMVMAGRGEALSALWFEEKDSFVFSHEMEVGEIPVFAETRQWLDAYFGGSIPGFLPSMALEGMTYRSCSAAAFVV